MTSRRVHDLTQGSPMKLVIGFAMPLLFGFFFQQLYNFVDTAIVGRALGSSALAAVGATGSLNFLVLGMCNGICSGFAIPVAQCFGAKEYGELRRYVVNAVYLCIGVSAVMSVSTGLLCGVFLRWMNTPADIIDDSWRYIAPIFWGIPATMLYNMSAGIMRSLGDSRTPVIYLILASAVNIVLDFVFILGLHMGVFGAAAATVISQAVAGVCCLVSIRRHFEILRLRPEDRGWRPLHAKKLMAIGVPMGLQFSITAIGGIILQANVNILGTVYVAAVSASGKLTNFFGCFFDALATTMATFAGQNLGARRLDRVNQGLNASLIIGTVYSITAYAAVRLFGAQMILLFLDPSETEVISLAYRFMSIYVAFFVPLLCVNVYRLTIQGLGFTTFAVFAGICEMIARTVVGAVFVPRIGFAAACFAHPAAWVAADLFLIPACYSVMRKLRTRLRAA